MNCHHPTGEFPPQRPLGTGHTTKLLGFGLHVQRRTLCGEGVVLFLSRCGEIENKGEVCLQRTNRRLLQLIEFRNEAFISSAAFLGSRGRVKLSALVSLFPSLFEGHGVAVNYQPIRSVAERLHDRRNKEMFQRRLRHRQREHRRSWPVRQWPTSLID